MKNIKIISLDQATKTTGWSLWDSNKLIDYGALNSNIKENNPIDRMQQMYFLIKNVVKKNKPDFVVLEGVQYQSNQRVYGQLSQMQGVVFPILFELDIGFMIVEATAWRKFCGIQGRKRIEQKASAIQTVKDRYSIDVSDDVAEAILIGEWAINNISEKK